MDQNRNTIDDGLFSCDFLDLDSFEDHSELEEEKTVEDEIDDVEYMKMLREMNEVQRETIGQKKKGEESKKENLSYDPSKSIERRNSGQSVKSSAIQYEKKSVGRELFGWLIYLVAVVLVTYLVITFVGQRTTVSGDSMYPSLQDGDNLLIDKISYQFVDPERYDIIVFPYQYETGKYYIKRIIGLPGDTVQIIDGEVYINGELLGETYGYEVMNSAGIAAEEIVLGEDEYFVLGDNRNNSSDSRDPSVGIIYGEDIVGKAFIRIWPLDSIGVISHE